MSRALSMCESPPPRCSSKPERMSLGANHNVARTVHWTLVLRKNETTQNKMTYEIPFSFQLNHFLLSKKTKQNKKATPLLHPYLLRGWLLAIRRRPLRTCQCKYLAVFCSVLKIAPTPKQIKCKKNNTKNFSARYMFHALLNKSVVVNITAPAIDMHLADVVLELLKMCILRV